MKNLGLVLFMVLSFVGFPKARGQDIPTNQAKNIEVIIGQDNQEFFNFAPSTNVQVGNDSILSYQLIPAKREITFKGQKPGKTTVWIRNQVGDIKARYNVAVVAHSKSKVIKELKEFLGDIEGLEITIKGDSVVLDGKIYVPNDIGRIATILEKYKDVILLVELAPQTKLIIARKMQEEIQKAGMKNVTVRVVNGSYWLEGVVTSEGQRARSELIAAAYLPEDIKSLGKRTGSVRSVSRDPYQNFITVNAESQPPSVPQLVKVTAQFVELTKDYNKVFGFKWIPLFNGNGGSITFGQSDAGGLTSKSNGTLSATISNLFPKLASAKSAGYARVIQSGVGIVENKKPLKLSKTTQRPFNLGTGEFTKALTASAGFNMDITPKILPEEKVEMAVNVGVSAVVGTPPETTNNSVSTTLLVKSKDSAAIGGIVINRTSTDYDRDPPFGQPQFSEEEGVVPLFSFLRSKSYANNRSQFVIFVTPEIVESASEGTEEIRKKFRQRGR